MVVDPGSEQPFRRGLSPNASARATAAPPPEARGHVVLDGASGQDQGPGRRGRRHRLPGPSRPLGLPAGQAVRVERGCRHACHGGGVHPWAREMAGPGRPPPRRRGRRRRGPRRPALARTSPGQGQGPREPAAEPVPEPRRLLPVAAEARRGTAARAAPAPPTASSGASHVATWPRVQPEPSCWTSSHAEVAVRTTSSASSTIHRSRTPPRRRPRPVGPRPCRWRAPRLGEQGAPLPHPVHARPGRSRTAGRSG